MAVRKITAHLPADLLAVAQAETGAGVTETLRQGLEGLRHKAFCRRMLELQGKIDFTGFDLEDLREDKEHGWADGPRAK